MGVVLVSNERGTKNKEGGGEDENGKRERRHAPEEDEDNRDRDARVERGRQDVCRCGESGAVEFGGNHPSQASGHSTSKRHMASGDKNSAPRYHHHPAPGESSRVGSGGGRPDVIVERRSSMSADSHSQRITDKNTTMNAQTHSYTSSTTRNDGGGSHTGR